MIGKASWLVLVGHAVLAPAHGQAQKPGSKTIVLKAAQMFDGKSNALVKPGVVVVTDGKIVVAGTGATVPAGAEVIDLGDDAAFGLH
jgi:imidazolonepropionase-like amidohydrolase